MFIGHTAVALAVKRARPAVPLPVLVAATYGPDVIEITLLALWRWANVPAAFGSHSIPSVALGASVVAAAYWLWRRDSTGAALLAATYASHWVADLFTGSAKPTWGGGPTLGLSLYEHPVLDFAVESALLVGAWFAFWPARDRRRRHPSPVYIGAPIALVLFQLVFNVSERLFGVRSVKDAVSSARSRGDAFSGAIDRTHWSNAARRTVRLAAWLLQRNTQPPFIRASYGGQHWTARRRDAGMPHLRQRKVLRAGGAAAGRVLRPVRQHRLPTVRHPDRA